jgi:hypothetical protein
MIRGVEALVAAGPRDVPGHMANGGLAPRESLGSQVDVTAGPAAGASLHPAPSPDIATNLLEIGLR